MPRLRATGTTRLALLCLALLAGSVYQLVVHPRTTAPTRTPTRTSAPTATAQRDRPSAPDAPQADAAPSYDLQTDERLGGHTIERHVGKSDDELADRLRREPQISAASTYPDLDTAQRTVAAAVAGSRQRVDGWAQRDGARPNLVVNYAAPDVVGRSLSRNARRAVPASRALVVLRWHERQGRWYVLTSYPEARR